MEHFVPFIRQLSKQLQKPLPGEAAQLKLEPATRRKYPLDPDAASAKLSAVLILFFPKEEQPNFALIQRPQYDGVHSGQIAFPGGKFENGDLTILDTALRETMEEIGIVRNQINVIGKLSPLYIPPSNFIVHPFVGYLDHYPEFTPDPLEVSKILEIPFDILSNPETLRMKEIDVRGYKVTVPCFYVADNVIWGATSMILSELIDLFYDKNNLVT